ncbi:ribonuclease J [Candidatus Microgenomates bacterium]|nr:ribonuclease J [Candidatus Microgenomates bacterium]
MESLKFIAISGTTKVTQNMYVYEYGSDIIIVDCGVGFPEEVAFGVDLVIPDFSYVLKNRERVRGILISHGHEDHFGALPFLLRDLDAPVYTGQLTAGFIKDKLFDHRIKARINPIFPDADTLTIGAFKIDAFRVTHSVPDSLGFCIMTPLGKFFHVSDHKFDWAPVDGKPWDLAKAARLAAGGVLAMASDALGATSEGYTKSELDLEKTIDNIIQRAPGRVFFTTISSNISRMQQAMNASGRNGRKITFIGRSIEQKIELANDLKYLKYNPGLVVNQKQAERMQHNKITFVVSGCYGQVGSALYKMAMGEHDSLEIGPGDVVIFSADPNPPGSEQTVNYVVDNLIEKGAEVHYYDMQEDLHVSGHGSEKEIEMLMALVRPKYFIPIGGTVRHMRAYKNLAKDMGFNPGNVFELTEGQVIDFAAGDGARRGTTVPVREVLVDGLGIGDVGEVVLRDRKTLAQEGIVIAVINFDKKERKIVDKPDLISRGFVFAKAQQHLIDNAARALLNEVNRRGKKIDSHLLREIRPMIMPIVVEV